MSYLSPIFKAGDTEDPINYRGIAVADFIFILSAVDLYNFENWLEMSQFLSTKFI